jgi:hypothetical protein
MKYIICVLLVLALGCTKTTNEPTACWLCSQSLRDLQTNSEMAKRNYMVCNKTSLEKDKLEKDNTYTLCFHEEPLGYIVTKCKFISN